VVLLPTDRDGSSRSSSPARHARWLLITLLVLALSARLYWILHDVPVLESEECEYTRLAQTLWEHHRYVGLREGAQLVYPPLLPVLVAVGFSVTGSYETAGRGVAFLAGLALVLAAFGLAQHMYGSRVAVIAATLAAGHPALIALSGAVYSECLYLPLMVGGAYFGLRCLEVGRLGSAIACGACFGLAYLSRPEALFYPFVIVAGVMVWCRARGTSARKAVGTAFLILVSFAVLATPYIAYLSSHAGGLRFEGKSVMNYTIGQRRNAGMTYLEATLGISPDLREEGPLLSPNTFVAQAPYPVPLRVAASYWLASARRNKTMLYESLVLSPNFGSLLGLGLVAVGLFRRPWSQRRLISEGALLAIVLGYVVILLGLHLLQFRYVLPLLPFLLIWGSKGIDEMARWGAASVRRANSRRFVQVGWVEAGGRLVLGSMMFLLAVRGASWGTIRDVGPRELALKDAGIWLAQYRSGPKRIFGFENEVSYYAGAVKLNFPYAPSALALRYVRAKAPDFLVLTRRQGAQVPYYQDWFAHGIPDHAAQLVYRTGHIGDHEVQIYQWSEGR
jgi:4-amino-4-deoxy-L-arabinose transferase-like glycosyltransferase